MNNKKVDSNIKSLNLAAIKELDFQYIFEFFGLDIDSLNIKIDFNEIENIDLQRKKIESSTIFQNIFSYDSFQKKIFLQNNKM